MDIYAAFTGKKKAQLTAQLHDLLQNSHTETSVFFRADDAGRITGNYLKLIELFNTYAIPLNIAVVPEWLTPEALNTMLEPCKRNNKLFRFHQHGWSHQNHEQYGKKSEFGPARSQQDIRTELTKGKAYLEKGFADNWDAVFTPPWNRCSEETIAILAECKFQGISRDLPAPERNSLKEISVCVDLHTIKSPTETAGWDKLFGSLKKGLQSDCCGIMIHHDKMDTKAFDFLELLLKEINNHDTLKTVSFKQILNKA